MKTITIRLPDVEAAMLAKLQKTNKVFRDLHEFMREIILREFHKSSSGKLD